MKSENRISKRLREKLACVGIGGWDCPCCRPTVVLKDKLNKFIRMKLKRELQKELKEGDGE